MIEKIKELIEEVEQFKIDTKENAEQLRLKFLSKKGIIAEIFSEFKKVEPAQKKEYGQRINSLKQKVEEKLALAQEALEEKFQKQNDIDITLPGPNFGLGSPDYHGYQRNNINFLQIGFHSS